MTHTKCPACGGPVSKFMDNDGTKFTSCRKCVWAEAEAKIPEVIRPADRIVGAIMCLVLVVAGALTMWAILKFLPN